MSLTKPFKRWSKSLNTNLDHARTHARLLVKALEWQDKNRNASFLLRGRELAEAEQWLLQTRAEQVPIPTPLHGEYISVSRRSASTRHRALIGTLSILLIVAAGLGLFAMAQKSLAEQRQRQAEANLDAACRNVYGMLEGLQVMDHNGIQFVDAEGHALPVGIIFWSGVCALCPQYL